MQVGKNVISNTEKIITDCHKITVYKHPPTLSHFSHFVGVKNGRLIKTSNNGLCLKHLKKMNDIARSIIRCFIKVIAMILANLFFNFFFFSGSAFFHLRGAKFG